MEESNIKKYVFKEDYSTSYGNRIVSFKKDDLCFIDKDETPFDCNGELLILIKDYFSPIAFVPISILEEL